MMRSTPSGFTGSGVAAATLAPSSAVDMDFDALFQDLEELYEGLAGLRALAKATDRDDFCTGEQLSCLVGFAMDKINVITDHASGMRTKYVEPRR